MGQPTVAAVISRQRCVRTQLVGSCTAGHPGRVPDTAVSSAARAHPPCPWRIGTCPPHLPATRAQATAYALTTTPAGAQQLVRFSPSAPGTVTTVGTTGVSLTGIDFRPATNQLYGYDGDKLYVVNLTTGSATLAFDVANVAGDPGFDFNPTVDRIRLVGSSGTNFRLNPLDGSTIVDGAYTFAMGDVNFGTMPSFTAVAYTNSDTDPATGTTLYAIDPMLGQLVRITNPNGGTINTVGNLGLGNFSAISGFDILTVGGINTAFFTGVRGNSMMTQLFSVDLTTGAATVIGNVGAAGTVRGLALSASVVPEPSTWALMGTGLLGLAVAKRRRLKTSA